MQGGYNHSNGTIIVHYFHKNNSVSVLQYACVVDSSLSTSQPSCIPRLDSFVSCFQNASPVSSRVSRISNVSSEDKSGPKIDFTKVPDPLTETKRALLAILYKVIDIKIDTKTLFVVRS